MFMNNNRDCDLKIQVADVIGNISEAILRREPPFDDLPIHEEVYSKTQLKFLHYYNDIEEKDRHDFLNCLIDLSRYTINDLILRNQKPFEKKHPGHKEIWKKLIAWSKTKNNDFTTKYSTQNIEKIESKELVETIKQVVCNRMHDFKYLPVKKGFPGLITFAKKWKDDNNFYILIDKGKKRFFLDFFIGIKIPKIIIDIACFFNGSQSIYRYHSKESLISTTNNAMDLVEQILPEFEKEISDLFKAL